MDRVSMHLLGTFSMVTTSGQPVQFRTNKIRALLAYLLLEGDRPHLRHSLAALLWPEMVQAKALKNLRQSLHRLQQALDEQSPGLSDKLFSITRQTVHFHGAERLDVDVTTLQRSLETCEAHPHRHLHLCHDCLARLASVVELYQGELMAGFGLPDATAFDEWLLFQRERLQQQVIGALSNLTSAHATRGENDLAYRYATRQVALDPFREDAHRQLMRLLALRGEHAQALAQYERCRELLLEEVGTEPAAETTALYQQIRAEQDGDVETTVVRAAALYHFPVQFTPFVGREEELRQIEEMFLDPDCRLLTLVGPGGIGKTRLAIHAGERLAAKGKDIDGIYFFSLASTHTEESLLTSLLNGLGIDAVAGSPSLDRVLNYLRYRQCLLVLDNFEQLVDSATVVARMLASAPGLRLLVTSHVPLHLRVERRLAVAGLDYPAEDEPLAAVASYSAVRLFVEAGHQIDITFRLTDENVADVLHICRLVGGMPLALELAAAWLRVTDCATIARELGRSLEFLSLSPQDRPERHQSIEAIFAYSWQLLSTDERTVLSQLAVFRGPFSLDAAMAVTKATPLTLARLLDKSMVHHSREGHYQLHELLRKFAEQAAGAQVEQVAREHSEYYLGLLTAQEHAFYGPQPRAAVAAVRPYLDNIRTAWEWAFAHGHRPAIERSMEALGRFYHVAALVQEGEAMFEWARDCFAQMPRLRVWYGYFLYKLGRSAEAMSQAEKALEESGEDKTVCAEAKSLLGEVLMREGQFVEARSYQQQAIDTFQASTDLERLARAQRRMVLTWWRSGDHDEALRYFQQTIPIHNAIGEKRGLAQLYNVLAGINYEQNNLSQALEYVEQAQALYEAIDDSLDAAVVAANLARLHSHLGNFEEALASNQRAIEISQELDDRPGLARDLSNRGYLLTAMGEFNRSLDYYFRALDIARRQNNWERVAEFQAGIAAAFALKGDTETALAYYDHALPVLQEQGVPYHILGPLLGKAELLYDRGDWAEARALCVEAQALATEAELPEYELQCGVLAAKLAFVEEGADAGRRQLAVLLDESEDEIQQAALHYELWKLTKDGEAAAVAAAGYRRAYERVPSFINRSRLQALERFLAASA